MNDGRQARLESRPGETGGIIDRALISSTEAPSTPFDILAEQHSDHRPCFMLVGKSRSARPRKHRRVFRYLTGGRAPGDNPLQTLR